ncbi:hypothetical protein KIPB_013047, partial [Kipferlia bialata]
PPALATDGQTCILAGGFILPGMDPPLQTMRVTSRPLVRHTVVTVDESVQEDDTEEETPEIDIGEWVRNMSRSDVLGLVRYGSVAEISMFIEHAALHQLFDGIHKK